MVTCPGCGGEQPKHALYCEKCGDPLFEGKQAGIYKIISRIGEGGMGSVYKAEHSKLGTHFALKMLHRQFTKRPELVTRFVNEARSTSRLRHEHIVFITDFGEMEGFGPYIAMEYLAGRTLKEALTPGDPLPIARALTIATQLAGTMAYAHSQGIVHRDLKPDNIFLIDREDATEDFTKVLDFGIAKMLQEEADTSLTQTGAVLGTPIYMSPEQALSKGLDHRADIYSFGIILFEMLTGFLPFKGDSAFEVIEQRLFHDAPKISAYAPQWAGSSLETLVAQCLMREPAERLQSMAEIKQALVQIHERHKQREAPRTKEVVRAEVSTLTDTEAAPESAPNTADVVEAPEHVDFGLKDTNESPQDTGAFAPRGSLPTGTMLGDLSDPNEDFVAPALPVTTPSPSLAPLEEEAPSRGKPLWLGLLVLCLFCAVAIAGWYRLRKPATPPSTRILAKAGQRLQPLPAAPTSPDASPQVPAPQPPDVAPQPPETTPQPARRRARRRPVQRRRPRWRPRRKVRRPVLRTVKRIVPKPRIVPRPRPKARALGPNGCLPRTDKVTHTRMFANDSKVWVKVGRVSGKWGRRLPKARGGGWCIPVPRGGIHVRIFGGHQELADCWFRLGYFAKPTFKVTLRNLEDGGPGRYCQPR